MNKKTMKNLLPIILTLFLLSGCALFKLPGKVVESAGTVVETAGKVVVATGQAIGKVAEAGGKTVETSGEIVGTAIKTPGVKEAVLKEVVP